jgi:hypothetical protein
LGTWPELTGGSGRGTKVGSDAGVATDFDSQSIADSGASARAPAPNVIAPRVVAPSRMAVALLTHIQFNRLIYVFLCGRKVTQIGIGNKADEGEE